MEEEFLDVLDEKGNETGIKKTKKEVHEKGLWHRAAHVWIYNSKGEILLQKRAKTMDSYPGLWDISSAGQVSAGEKPEESAIRELKEELGIEINSKDLKSIGVRKVSQSVPKKNWHNNEFYHVYLIKLDIDLSEIILQKEEVEKVEFISPEKLEADIKDPEEHKKYVPHGEYYLYVTNAVKKEIDQKH